MAPPASTTSPSSPPTPPPLLPAAHDAPAPCLDPELGPVPSPGVQGGCQVKVLEALAVEVSTVGPGVPADTGGPGPGDHHLLGRHRGRREAAAHRLLGVRPVDVILPGSVLLGAPEGARTAERLHSRHRVTAASIGPLTTFASEVAEDQPHEAGAEVQVVSRIGSPGEALGHCKGNANISFSTLLLRLNYCESLAGQCHGGEGWTVNIFNTKV